MKSIGASIAVREHATLFEPIVVRGRLARARRRRSYAQRHLRQNGWLENPLRRQQPHELTLKKKPPSKQFARQLRAAMELRLLPQEVERREAYPCIQIDRHHAECGLTLERAHRKVKPRV